MRNLTKRLQNKIQNTLSDMRFAFRGVLNLVKSADTIQKVQVSGLSGETLQDVEFMQQFGLTSVPPTGTQVVVLPMGGKTTHSIVIATENGSFRVKNLKGGEVAVYDQSGSTIILKQGRLIEVDCDIFKLNCKSYQLNCQTCQTTASGGITFDGDISQQGHFTNNSDVVASGVSLTTHTHPGDSGGSTGMPS